MARNSIILLLIIFVSCTSNKTKINEDHPELAYSIISPSPGMNGFFVHRNRSKHVKKYKLDENFLKIAQQIKIVCYVAEQLYSVCSDKLGLCRNEKTYVKRNKFFGPKYKNVITQKFIPFSDYDFLITTGTYCKSGL